MSCVSLSASDYGEKYTDPFIRDLSFEVYVQVLKTFLLSQQCQQEVCHCWCWS